MGEPDKTIGNVKIKVTNDGLVFARVHELMDELRMLTKFEAVYIEKPLDPARIGRNTGFDVPWYSMGLAAHAHSYCEARSIRTCEMIDLKRWRSNFIGKMPREAKSKMLKDYTVQRAKSLGFAVRNDDEADAVGLMDYAVEMMLGRLPPWREGEVLRAPLSGGGV